MHVHGTDSSPSGVTLALVDAGFSWVSPGYWSIVVDGVELTLEPQVENAGDWKLGLYHDRVPQLEGELLVDVRPRPSASS